MTCRASSYLLLISLLVPTFTAPAATAAENLFAWDEALRGDEETELRWPVALATNGEDEIVVGDAFGSRLVVFSRKTGGWQVENTVALAGPPVGVAHDGRRYLVSLRHETRLVAVEGPRHQLRRVSLPADAVPGPLAARRDGGFLVFDFAGGRVLILDGELGLAREIPVEGHVTALSAAPSGGFYAAFGDAGEVRRFGPEGQPLASWTVPGPSPVPAWPTGLVVEAGGDMVMSDRHGDRLVVLETGGRLAGTGSRKGWDPGLLLFPADLTQLSDGRFAVADQGNGRIQIFRRLSGGSTP